MPQADCRLAGEPRSSGLARRFLAERLAAWGGQEYGDAATLLIGEMVANAVLHARTDLTVRLSMHDAGLRIEVSDLSDRRPVVRHYSMESTTGRGLGLIDEMAQRWGVTDAPPGSGKTVWVELDAAAMAGNHAGGATSGTSQSGGVG
ncbi:MAG: ATP-binding protein [Acidimicrobiales bacterium]